MRQEQLDKIDKAILVVLPRERTIDSVLAQPAILVHREANSVDAPAHHSLYHANVGWACKDRDVVDAGVFSAHHCHPFEVHHLACVPVNQLVAHTMKVGWPGSCCCQVEARSPEEQHWRAIRHATKTGAAGERVASPVLVSCTKNVFCILHTACRARLL